MIIIEIKKGESIDVALKKLKNKFKRIKTTEELRERKTFEKPSETKRKEKKKAIYIQKLKNQEDKS
jgi:small subunit ribosomal protein S21